MFDFKKEYYLTIAFISSTHFLIDGIKLLKPIKNERILFFLDQLAHIGILFWVANSWSLSFDIQSYITEKNLLFLLAIVLLTAVTSIVLKVVFSCWKKEIEEINRQIEQLESRLNNISNTDTDAHQKMIEILTEINDLKCKLIDGTNRLLIKTNKIFGDVSFNTGKSNLTKRGKEELDEIASSIEIEVNGWKNYLNTCNERVFENDVFVVVIDIDGYADAVGGSKLNLTLSKDRALEVQKHLENRFFELVENKRLNIVFKKINAKGYGEKLPPGISASTKNDPERRVCYIYSVVGPSKLLNN